MKNLRKVFKDYTSDEYRFKNPARSNESEDLPETIELARQIEEKTSFKEDRKPVKVRLYSLFGLPFKGGNFFCKYYWCLEHKKTAPLMIGRDAVSLSVYIDYNQTDKKQRKEIVKDVLESINIILEEN